MKQIYQPMMMEFLLLDTEDVIATSGLNESAAAGKGDIYIWTPQI